MHPSETVAERSVSLRALFLGAFVVLLLLVGVLALYVHHQLEVQTEDATIELQLALLATRRPAEVTPRQWESAVAWTRNLHGNSLLFAELSLPQLRAFSGKLEQKLAGPVSLETIDWIWDAYAAAGPHGAAYQRFRSVMHEEIAAGGADWSLDVP